MPAFSCSRPRRGRRARYTVTVKDGLGGTPDFTINVGTNPYDPPNPWVNPSTATTRRRQPGDQIYTAANTPATFTPQGESADGTPVQVNVQLLRPVPTVSGDFVDNSYTGTNPPADTTNTDMTLTQSGSSYTVTPTSGYYGVQVLEVTGFTPVSGTFAVASGIDNDGVDQFRQHEPGRHGRQHSKRAA